MFKGPFFMNASLPWVEELRHFRKDALIGREVLYYEEIDSTNRLAREKASCGEKEGTVILAEAQTQGKGRMGRSWSSPRGKNLYLSVILRPAISPQQAPQITLLAGVCLARALIQYARLDARIKWPNDIFIRGKKAAGILAEMEADRARTHFIILGIGINVNWAANDMPPDLWETATSLGAEAGREFNRAWIASGILEELGKEYALFLREGFSARIREEWNRLSFVNEKWATLNFLDQKISGKILGLDTDGALLLIDPEGKTHRFMAGDVSLRI
jgi:BirA family biotin operon repressor/biotin-[acetyl-CoA-carboxylase] ligase